MTETDAHTRLREAALELFGRQGIRDTSTREILAAARMRNPSAISYHFGSKAGLVADLAGELIGGEAPVLQRQVELAQRPEPPTIEAWTAVAVDSAAALISTERGRLLARVWSEYAGYLEPMVFEKFLMSDHRLADAWRRAVARTFPELPHFIAIARNTTMLRTLDFLVTRRAERILNGQQVLVPDPKLHRLMMLEVAVAMLSAPTTLTDADLTTPA